jgi:hypothetical protein
VRCGWNELAELASAVGLYAGATDKSPADQFVAAEAVGWIRRNDQLGGVAALSVYLVLVGLRQRCCPRSSSSAGS